MIAGGVHAIAGVNKAAPIEYSAILNAIEQPVDRGATDPGQGVDPVDRHPGRQRVTNQSIADVDGPLPLTQRLLGGLTIDRHVPECTCPLQYRNPLVCTKRYMYSSVHLLR